MSYFTVVGASFFVSATIAAATTISDITNAPPPVFTDTAHGYSTNDELLLLIGWEDFNGSVIRATVLNANTFSMPGYDASNTDFYAPGSDTGTAQKITAWTQLGQILSITNSGGDPKFIDLNPYDLRRGKRILTGTNPSSMEMTLGWDRSRADQTALAAASQTQASRAFKYVLAGPSYCYGYGQVSVGAPIFEDVIKIKVSVTFDGLFTAF